MIPGRIYTPERMLSAVWSWRWVILTPAVVFTIGAIVYAKSLPNLYRAQTTILVLPQRVPADYVRPTVTIPLEGRLPSLAQQILSRSRLERIINDFNLYADLRHEKIMDDIVAGMRTAIGIQSAPRSNSFSLSFQYGDPATTARVADRLASLFIEENLRDREVMADGTSQFLETQLEDARRRLIEVEKHLENYRRRYAGQLPAQLPSNLQMLTNLNTQVQAVTEALNRDRDRKIAVQALLADLSVPIVTAPMPAGPAANQSPNAASLTPAQQLEAARAEFRAIEGRLKPDHPDYGRARRRLEELERKAQQETVAPPQRAEAIPAAASPAEIARRNRVAELRAELTTLDRQIGARTEQEQHLRREIGMYEARIEATPTREAEMTELTRDYATLQESYRSLLVKRQDSQIAANLERRQGGEQFKVLDAAHIPERAASPNRPLITIIGAVFGLLIGSGLSVVGELRDKTLRGPDEVVQALALPVFVVIPTVTTTGEKRARRRRQVRLAAAVGAVLLVGAAGLGVWTFGW